MTWPDGRRYEGDFWNYYFHNPNMLEEYGFGKMTWPKDADGVTTEYEGTFKYSHMHGMGSLTRTKADGSTETYRGEFEYNKRHGKGTVTFSNRKADNYDAEWEAGKMVEDSKKLKGSAKMLSALASRMSMEMKTKAEDVMEQLKEKKGSKSTAEKLLGGKFAKELEKAKAEKDTQLEKELMGKLTAAAAL